MNKNIVVETSASVENQELDIEIEVKIKPNLPLHTDTSNVVKSTTNTVNGHKLVETIRRV